MELQPLGWFPGMAAPILGWFQEMVAQILGWLREGWEEIGQRRN
jgi:hypothetical protein